MLQLVSTAMLAMPPAPVFAEDARNVAYRCEDQETHVAFALTYTRQESAISHIDMEPQVLGPMAEWNGQVVSEGVIDFDYHKTFEGGSTHTQMRLTKSDSVNEYFLQWGGGEHRDGIVADAAGGTAFCALQGKDQESSGQ